MATAVAILGSLGVIGLLMAPVRADGGRRLGEALWWATGGAFTLVVAVLLFLVGPVDGVVWLIPLVAAIVFGGLIVFAT